MAKKLRKLILSFCVDDGAQAVVEYILGVVLVLSLFSILALGFRRILMSLWISFAKAIVAPCPGCPSELN